MDGNSYTYGDEIERLFIFNVSNIEEDEPIDFSMLMDTSTPKKEDDSAILKQLQQRAKLPINEEKPKESPKEKLKINTPEPNVENKEATATDPKAVQKPSSSTSETKEKPATSETKEKPATPETKEKPATRPSTLKLPTPNVDKAANKDKVAKAASSLNGVEKPKSHSKSGPSKSTEKNQ